jgi:uncharacterized membrane protein YfcA
MIEPGVVLGGYFGDAWTQQVSQLALRRIFAAAPAATAMKMFFQK